MQSGTGCLNIHRVLCASLQTALRVTDPSCSQSCAMQGPSPGTLAGYFDGISGQTCVCQTSELHSRRGGGGGDTPTVFGMLLTTKVGSGHLGDCQSVTDGLLYLWQVLQDEALQGLTVLRRALKFQDGEWVVSLVPGAGAVDVSISEVTAASLMIVFATSAQNGLPVLSLSGLPHRIALSSGSACTADFASACDRFAARSTSTVEGMYALRVTRSIIPHICSVCVRIWRAALWRWLASEQWLRLFPEL